MLKQPGRKTGLHLFLVVALVLMFQGCGGGGGSSYDAPSTTSTGAAVNAATVKSWVDSGKVNGTGYDRVVILDLGSSADYAAGHIPGAQWVDRSGLYENRDGGVLTDVNMVLDGPTMDALIQKYGIDKNTTIVFTSSDSTAKSIAPYYFVGRAYWTFRYWGFPKDRLKVLNGLDAAYADSYSLTSDASPAVTPSTYSVRQNASFRGDLRATIGDMISIADGTVPNAVVVDTRGEDGDGYNTTSSYNGDPEKTTGVWTKGTYVVFEGHIKGAVALSSNFFFKTVTGTTQTYKVFLAAPDMAAVLAAKGINSTDKIVVHCRTGVIASGAFVAIDAVLGWQVANYDGSWSQWGMLSGSADNCGPLAANSPWRTDINGRTQDLTYNYPTGVSDCSGIEDATDGGKYSVDSFDTDLNRINDDDKAYFSAGGSSSGGGGGGGGNIGC